MAVLMICFVQARMNSKRLPGKTMKIIKNKPVLFYVLSRLKKSKFLKKIVVLTSTKKTDNIIVKYCEDNNVQVLVDNITAGYGSNGLAAAGSYGGGYVAISNSSSPSTILSGGLATTNLGHGVENAAADVNLRVLMDWAKDVEGAYSVTTTLTIVDTD